MATGVSLRDDAAGVPPRAHAHAEGDGWRITSDVALRDVLTAPVLDRTLPGALGRYVYPEDAVLHLTDRARTTAADLLALFEAHAVDDERHLGPHVANQLTVEAVADELPVDDGVEEEEDDEQDLDAASDVDKESDVANEEEDEIEVEVHGEPDKEWEEEEDDDGPDQNQPGSVGFGGSPKQGGS